MGEWERLISLCNIQWNPSIVATVGEWHFGCYTEVAVVGGFRVLCVLVHEKLQKASSIVVCTEVVHIELTILYIRVPSSLRFCSRMPRNRRGYCYYIHDQASSSCDNEQRTLMVPGPSPIPHYGLPV